MPEAPVAAASYGHAFGHGKVDDEPSMAMALTIFSTFIVLGCVYVYKYAQKKRHSQKHTLIALWYWVDACTHLFFEHSFVWLSLGGAKTWPANVFISSWREYGRADKRWAFLFDPSIVSVEIMTVFVVGPLCLLALYALLNHKRYYHFVQIVLCVCELYGGWITFGPEWITGSPNLETGNWLYLWFYLTFMNGVWVLIPGYLLYDSYYVIEHALHRTQTSVSSSAVINSPQQRSMSPARSQTPTRRSSRSTSIKKE